MPAASFTVDPPRWGGWFGRHHRVGGHRVTVRLAILRGAAVLGAASLADVMGLEFGFPDALPRGIGLLRNPLSAYLAPGFGRRRIDGGRPRSTRSVDAHFTALRSPACFCAGRPYKSSRVLGQLACLTVVTWLNTGVLRRLDHGYFRTSRQSSR